MAKKSWWRLYNRVANDAKLRQIPAELFRSWAIVNCIFSDNGGTLPPMKDIAFTLRVSERVAAVRIEQLVQARLYDRLPDGTVRPHDWDEWQYESDNSTERVRKLRERQKETLQETGVKRFSNGGWNGPDTETEQRQSRAEAESPPPPLPAPQKKGSFALHDFFESVYATHPKKKNRGIAENYLAKAYDSAEDKDAFAQRFSCAHRAWCQSEEWRWKNGAKAPELAQWILDHGWEYMPPSPEKQEDPW